MHHLDENDNAKHQCFHAIQTSKQQCGSVMMTRWKKRHKTPNTNCTYPETPGVGLESSHKAHSNDGPLLLSTTTNNVNDSVVPFRMLEKLKAHTKNGSKFKREEHCKFKKGEHGTDFFEKEQPRDLMVEGIRRVAYILPFAPSAPARVVPSEL